MPEFHHFVELRERLVFVQDESADGHVVVALGQFQVEQFDLDLPESDEYMTVGGLILHEYQSFPKLNEIIKIGRYEFKIVKNTATKIELVRLKVID